MDEADRSGTDYVPVAPVAAQPAAMPAPAGDVPTSKSRPWTTWLIVAGVILVLLGCCIVPTVAGLWFTMDADTSVSGDSIALIHLDDVIAGTGVGVTPEAFHDVFASALDDESVRAIVLRVDSPGGTVAASQEIAAYVAESDKPVVVSVGDVCASGAYMVASQADEIVAMPGSSVGSIGVIMQIPNLEGLMDKLGIDYQTLIAGERKDEGSAFRPLTPEEIAAFQGDLDEIHTQFIGTVAEGRGISADEVRALATGETFLASKAVDLGLVDTIGTLEDAYASAAALAGISEWTVVDFDGDVDFLTGLFLDSFGMLGRSGVLEGSSDPRPALR